MSSQQHIKLIGAVGSPYTHKMLALLRYRHIAYSVTWAHPSAALDVMGIEKPRPCLLPTFLYENDDGSYEAVCDSTPIIRDLETTHTQRSVIPSNPIMAFLNYLIEDFADEWCTKYMFHYRWHPSKDADNAGTFLPLTMDVSLSSQDLSDSKDAFSQHQINRLYVVGSNATTAAAIDASFRRFLLAIEGLFTQREFLFGTRPASADFALFGQLSQLIGVDPTSRQIAHDIAPRTIAWVGRMNDLSGIEASPTAWCQADEMFAALKPLLQEIGRGYVPAMLANNAAVKQGDKDWQCTIDDTNWAQLTFPYQAKCLRWLNEQYQALSEKDQGDTLALLNSNNCGAIIQNINSA